MSMSHLSKAFAFTIAGFAAGVVAVMACDDGPSGAGAQAACDACTVEGPIQVRVPVCLQWDMLANSTGLSYSAPGQTSSQALAPNGWEPVAPLGENYHGWVLFRRCTRWGTQDAP